MALIGKHHQTELENIAKNYGFYVHKTGLHDVIFKTKETNATVTWYFTKGTVLVQGKGPTKSLKHCDVDQFTSAIKDSGSAMKESKRYPLTEESSNYSEKRKAPEHGREVLSKAFRLSNMSSPEPRIMTTPQPANPGRESEIQQARMFHQRMEAAYGGRGVATNTDKEPNDDKPDRIKYEQLTDEQKEVAGDVMSGRNVFITGAAGTGKSFLFQYLLQQLQDRFGEGAVAVTAPTGIAAVNVDGVTIHSFAGIGLGKGKKEELLEKVKSSKKARANWRETKVLMIDEISMLGSELFTKLAFIGACLKGKGNIPFGGIQMVVCGDFFQLPPVKLGTAMVGSFAFDSPEWKDLNMKTWQLKVIVRQKDAQFIKLLNKVRRGDIDQSDIDLLETCNSRTKAVPEDGIIPTKLMCINKDVDAENNQRLKELDGEEITSSARDTIVYSKCSEGKLKEDIEKKAPGMLILKLDAQVVLIRNIDVGRKLVNGSRGVVTGFEEMQFVPNRRTGEKLSGTFLCPIIKWDCGVEELLRPVEFGYHNPIVGKILRVQFPLKLAWSLTVHKSQGMTLSRAVITVANAFENGQVYVALSRCVSLDGLWMSGESLSPEAVKAHYRVKEFYDQ